MLYTYLNTWTYMRFDVHAFYFLDSELFFRFDFFRNFFIADIDDSGPKNFCLTVAKP